jgi:hypothetical protein
MSAQSKRGSILDFLHHYGIPYDGITENDLICYCNSEVDWFQEEVIIISVIDKLVQLNYEQYKEVIFKLHEILIINLNNLMKRINNNTNIYGLSYAHSYILYLLTNRDLSKLKPTIQYGFMYLIYYKDFYTVLLWDDKGDSCGIDDIMYNGIFNDEIFALIFHNIMVMDIDNSKPNSIITRPKRGLYDDANDANSSKKNKN